MKRRLEYTTSDLVAVSGVPLKTINRWSEPGDDGDKPLIPPYPDRANLGRGAQKLFPHRALLAAALLGRLAAWGLQRGALGLISDEIYLGLVGPDRGWTEDNPMKKVLTTAAAAQDDPWLKVPSLILTRWLDGTMAFGFNDHEEGQVLFRTGILNAPTRSEARRGPKYDGTSQGLCEVLEMMPQDIWRPIMKYPLKWSNRD